MHRLTLGLVRPNTTMPSTNPPRQRLSQVSTTTWLLPRKLDRLGSPIHVDTDSAHRARLARVGDVGRLPNGSPYILMEYLVGRDLAAVLNESGPLSIADAVECVLQACAGIADAHALGIVHRDVKPSNLFLTQRQDGSRLIKVLDFGLSKAVDPSTPNAARLTKTAAVFGSPAYMSPEQIRSSKHVDARADIWSLGVILYELVTNELPFNAQTIGALLSAVAADEPSVLTSSRDLDVIVRRCLEKDVTKRYQVVTELARALATFRAGGRPFVVVPASELPPPDAATPTTMPATLRVVIIGLALILVAIFGALYALSR